MFNDKTDAFQVRVKVGGLERAALFTDLPTAEQLEVVGLQPPETIGGRIKGWFPSSDVWTVGILMWKLYSLPEVMSSTPESDHFMSSGLFGGSFTLTKPYSCPDAIWKLIKECTERQPSTRPKMQQVQSQLEHIIVETAARQLTKSKKRKIEHVDDDDMLPGIPPQCAPAAKKATLLRGELKEFNHQPSSSSSLVAKESTWSCPSCKKGNPIFLSNIAFSRPHESSRIG